MPNEPADHHDSLGAWTKRYYFANRAALESVLRPWDLGSTQWYVLSQLANSGPTMQRDLGQLLHIERATLSGVIATMVRKGLVEQVPDAVDQRQRILHLTVAGAELWKKLPNPIDTLVSVAQDGVDAADMQTAIRVLKAAVAHLDGLSAGDAH